MSRFEEYLEAVRSVVEISEGKNKYKFQTKQEMDKAIEELPGETSQDKILSFLKIEAKWGGTLRHDSRNKNIEKFGIYYKAADEDEGAILGFDPSKYPGVNINSLKEKYIKMMKRKSIDYWSDEEVTSELPRGYEGFAWGDPEY